MSAAAGGSRARWRRAARARWSRCLVIGSCVLRNQASDRSEAIAARRPVELRRGQPFPRHVGLLLSISLLLGIIATPTQARSSLCVADLCIKVTKKHGIRTIYAELYSDTDPVRVCISKGRFRDCPRFACDWTPTARGITRCHDGGVGTSPARTRALLRGVQRAGPPVRLPVELCVRNGERSRGPTSWFGAASMTGDLTTRRRAVIHRARMVLSPMVTSGGKPFWTSRGHAVGAHDLFRGAPGRHVGIAAVQRPGLSLAAPAAVERVRRGERSSVMKCAGAALNSAQDKQCSRAADLALQDIGSPAVTSLLIGRMPAVEPASAVTGRAFSGRGDSHAQPDHRCAHQAQDSASPRRCDRKPASHRFYGTPDGPVQLSVAIAR